MATTTTSAACFMILCCCCVLFSDVHAASVPAVYVFGDSLADVGNNHHIPISLLRADFPHNGIDFPGGVATGRFSNGRNSADILAAKLGIPSSPPFLAIASSSNATAGAFLAGVSFASGGAGILDATHQGQCLSFNKQIDSYSIVYAYLVQQLGSSKAQDHLSKSIFAFVIGSNDILNYKPSTDQNQLETPLQFVKSLTDSMKSQLKRIYNLGARKFFFIGTGPIGCCPAQIIQSSTGGCYTKSNYLSLQYNKGIVSLLQEMKSEFRDMSYTFLDTYSVLHEFIQNPAAHGFTEVEAACCGLGNLSAKAACVPISALCNNRKDHVFWDFYHPTETAAELIISAAFDGSPPYVHPINVKQLSAL